MIRDVFLDTYNYMKSGHLMRQVVNKIQEINFNRSDDKHIFGSIYEQILKDLQSAGNAGEFYTPRAVTQFMVDMIAPSLGNTILDPACGTGGFLTCVLTFLRRQANTPEDWEKLQNSTFGVEKKALPHLLCTTNMLLHGIEVPVNIKHDNMLSTPIKDHPWRKKIDVIVTNPPFGGMEEDGIENNFPAAYRTRETADLFLFMIVEMLKNGGRAAVVLPDGTLFGEGIKTRLKEKLLHECNLHTIVRLPKGVFSPYTDIKTNLLFFEKGKQTDEIWYYEHQYPSSYKSYSKTKPIRIEEFEMEKAWWANRQESDNAWKVNIEQIKANNYNLDIKNPNKQDSSHRDSIELLAEYEQATTSMHQTQNKLKDMLAEALRGHIKSGGAMQAEIFLQKFGQLAQGPEGIKKFRDLILQLAVRGMLVDQDPTNEAAEALLSKIRLRKQELLVTNNKRTVASSKYYSGKEEKPIIPFNWVISNLAELGVINPRNQVEDTLEVGFISMSLISEKYGNYPKWESKKWAAIKQGYTHFADEDVGLAKITPCFENGKSAVFRGLPNGIGAGTTELHIFRDITGMLIPEYVWIWLKSPGFIEEGKSSMTGTAGQKRVTKDYFSLKPFPLPPLEEQKRIVAKVDELMALCDQLDLKIKESQSLSEQLFDSILHQIWKNAA